MNNLMNRLRMLTSINKFISLAAILVIGLAGYMIFASTAMGPGPKLYMQLGGGSETSHSSIEVEVRLDTAGHDVNAVQADLNYPTDNLQFIRTEVYESAFSVEAESEGGDGLVKIARGNQTSVNGDVLVAKVWFEVLESEGNKNKNKGRTTLSFADTSKVVSASDNQDILSSTKTLNYDVNKTDKNKGKGHGRE